MTETSSQASADRAAQRRGRRALVLMAALFIGPVLLSYFLYFGLDGWRPAGSAVHGVLIEPPLEVSATPLGNLNSQGEGYSVRDHWHLVQIIRPACADECVEQSVKSRQVRLALGKESDRVTRVLLLAADTDVAEWRRLHPDAVLVAASDPARPALESVLTGAVAGGEGIFVIDPIGNLMLHFTGDAQHKLIHKDLKRLLRLSQIG